MTSCPDCGEQYQRLAQHWAMSSECSAPPIPTDSHAVLTGLGLAGATIYGAANSANPKFRVTSNVRCRVEWWNSELGWLSTGVRDHRPERSADSYVRDPGYQMTTLAHSDLNHYTWTLGEGIPPRELSLSPLAVRAWLSHMGGLSFEPNARLSFSAKPSAERRERLATLLRSLDCGLDPTVTDTVVSLSVAETKRLQEFAAPAAPGAEYRWARTEDEYERLR